MCVCVLMFVFWCKAEPSLHLPQHQSSTPGQSKCHNGLCKHFTSKAKGVQMWASGWWRSKYVRMCLLIVKKYPFSSCKHWSLLDWFAWCCNHCNQLIDFGRRLKDLIDGVWIQRLRSIFTTDGQRTKQITRQDYLNLNGKGAKSVKKTCHHHPIITFRNGHKLLTSGLSCCVFILSIDH